MLSAVSNSFSRMDSMPVRAPGLSAPNAAATATAAPEQSFAAAMAEVMQDASRSLKGAETTSIQGINGQTSTQAVVDAVMGAERTLQTAVALRDKVVSAYLELSRMSI
jgi:flagellar hook-basal body complex protein FliE